ENLAWRCLLSRLQIICQRQLQPIIYRHQVFHKTPCRLFPRQKPLPEKLQKRMGGLSTSAKIQHSV
ncbi:MAG: hypothetical protein LBV07_00140, partial [Syntrophobacterales bacterium]|nr:hypothetical protein [Syntrophobacterales bacterium]